MELIDYLKARSQISEKDFNKAGLPKLGALNAILKGMDLHGIKAEERNALEDAVEDPSKETEGVRVIITSAPMDPVPLYIHHLGRWSMRVGEEYSLPPQAVQALRDANIQVKEV